MTGAQQATIERNLAEGREVAVIDARDDGRLLCACRGTPLYLLPNGRAQSAGPYARFGLSERQRRMVEAQRCTAAQEGTS